MTFKAVRLGTAAIVVVIGVGATAAFGAGGPYTATRTSACLNARKVLASPFDRTRLLPPGARPRPVAAILVGFPFSPGKAKVDSAVIVFMSTPAVASQRLKAILVYQYASAA